MSLLIKIINFIFDRFPPIKEFCFLFFPLSVNERGTDWLFNAQIWRNYLSSHKNPLSSLPAHLDHNSIIWVKRLLHRRETIRYFLTLDETIRYYQAKHILVPYWFPDDGTLLKAVFLNHVGADYIPPKHLHTLKNRVAIDGGPASGDSSIALIECGVSRVLAFEPSPNQQKEMNAVLKKNDMTSRIEIIPFALGENKQHLSFNDQYGKRCDTETITIDEYCQTENIGCIKLDIEGSEFPAIKGAVKTIERCHPILLICVYHRPEDLFELPIWIQKRFPFYRFRIRDTEPGNKYVGAHLMLIAWPNEVYQ